MIATFLTSSLFCLIKILAFLKMRAADLSFFQTVSV